MRPSLGMQKSYASLLNGLYLGEIRSPPYHPQLPLLLSTKTTLVPKMGNSSVSLGKIWISFNSSWFQSFDIFSIYWKLWNHAELNDIQIFQEGNRTENFSEFSIDIFLIIRLTSCLASDPAHKLSPPTCRRRSSAPWRPAPAPRRPSCTRTRGRPPPPPRHRRLEHWNIYC